MSRRLRAEVIRLSVRLGMHKNFEKVARFPLGGRSGVCLGGCNAGSKKGGIPAPVTFPSGEENRCRVSLRPKERPQTRPNPTP